MGSTLSHLSLHIYVLNNLRVLCQFTVDREHKLCLTGVKTNESELTSLAKASAGAISVGQTDETGGRTSSCNYLQRAEC